MAHNLEIKKDGAASMAYAGDAPWHGLGVPVDSTMSAHDMMVAAGCDWKVGKFDTFIFTGPAGKAGTQRVKTGNKALMRLTDNKILSPNVGPDWEPLQNEDAFAFFHDFVEAGDMTMETAGSLQGGLYVWALAKVGEDFTILGGDKVESYLLLANSHRYGKSITVDFTPIRVVCNNTLTMALSTKSLKAVTVNHRAPFDADAVKEMMGLASNKMSQYKDDAEAMAAVKCSDDQALEFFKALWPVHVKPGAAAKKETSKLAAQAMAVHHNNPGAEFAPGTWWETFNTATYMVDHELCREQDTRLFNSWLGSTRQTKADAYKMAMAAVS